MKNTSLTRLGNKVGIEGIAPKVERDESVGIIGAGPGGLAAADVLRRAGVQVTGTTAMIGPVG